MPVCFYCEGVTRKWLVSLPDVTLQPKKPGRNCFDVAVVAVCASVLATERQDVRASNATQAIYYIILFSTVLYFSANYKQKVNFVKTFFGLSFQPFKELSVTFWCRNPGTQ